MTPLHAAAFLSREKVVKKLLLCGADQKLQLFDTHETPLELARRLGHREVVLVLSNGPICAVNSERKRVVLREVLYLHLVRSEVVRKPN